MKKIALEEHFMAPGLETYWESTMGNVARPMYRYQFDQPWEKHSEFFWRL